MTIETTVPQNLLQQWSQRGQGLSTLGQFQQFRTTAQLLNQQARGALPVAPESEAVTRAVFGQLLRGLQDPEAVSRVAALLSPDALRRMESDLSVGQPAPQTTAIVGPVSESAQGAKTVGGYAWGRRGTVMSVVSDSSHTDAALDAYRFDPERMKGRFISHESVERTPLSHEGFESFEAQHEEELAKMRKFLEMQLSFGDGPVRTDLQTTYDGIQIQMINYGEAIQKRWDEMITLINSHNPPPFEAVSEAYWDRDQAIRQNPFLKSKGIGPWEFDLIKAFRSWKNHPLEAEAGARQRFQRFAASWAYIFRKIDDVYNHIKSLPADDRTKGRLQRLADERFALEKAFWSLAQGEENIDAALLVSQAEGKYMAFLDFDLNDRGLGAIRELDQTAEATQKNYETRWHEINVATARQQYDFFKFRMQQDFEMEKLEHTWQISRYAKLIDWIAASGRLPESKAKKLHELVQSYKDKGEEYLKVAQAMLNEDPGTREHNRNNEYRDLFLVLWEDLHYDVKKAMQKAEMPNADRFELLTFTYKAQAQLIANGEKSVHGVEPLVEVTLGLKGKLEEQENGAYLLPTLAAIAGRDWGANLLSHYVREMHIVGIKALFGYFAQGLRPESYAVEGGMGTFPEGVEDLPTTSFSRRGAILDVTHTGQLEFPQAMGVTYLMGLPHTAILAQSGVGYFPIAGPFLSWLEKSGYRHLGSGALINRGANAKKRAFADFTQKAHVAMGNFLNNYPGGTRKIASPVPSMYVDLRKHPEALHMADFYPTDYSTGQPIKVAMDSGAPTIPVAHNLGRIYAEPSMPMPPEVEIPTLKDLRKPGKFFSKVGKLLSYPEKLKGFVSRRTMFPYMRPGTQDATVAYGEPMFVGSFLGEEDLEAAGFGPELAEWSQLPQKERDRNVKWLLLQRNYATVRTGEMKAGYTAAAGIYRKPCIPKHPGGAV